MTAAGPGCCAGYRHAAPGDIRHCMEALANTEPIMQKLLTYRFTEGSLAGQSFGNLILPP